MHYFCKLLNFPTCDASFFLSCLLVCLFSTEYNKKQNFKIRQNFPYKPIKQWNILKYTKARLFNGWNIAFLFCFCQVDNELDITHHFLVMFTCTWISCFNVQYQIKTRGRIINCMFFRAMNDVFKPCHTIN